MPGSGTRGASGGGVGPHDALFKHVFSIPEHAAAELAYVLPSALSARIDWSTLRLEPGSFVEPELVAQHTDLLFSVRLVDGSQALIHLLFEHQSQPHRWMPLRMAGYSVRILEAARARAPGEPLPMVIPVVLHHHGRGWNEARSLRALYGGDPAWHEEVGESTLQLRIFVDDLAAYPEAAIVARPMPALVRLVLGVLRDARDHDLGVLFDRWGPLMIEAARALGLEAVAAVLRYLMNVLKIEDPRVLLATARERGGIELEEVAMDWMEKLKEEGKAEGIALGRAERAELLLRQLKLRFGELGPELVARVLGASVEEHRAMAERVLTAGSADEVVG